MNRFALVLLSAALAACRTSPPPEAARPQEVSVTLARANRMDFRAPVEAGGILRARTTAQIASRIMAPITQVHVRPGDRVRRGAALVTLDSREATANRTRAGASLQSSVDTVRAAESEIQAAEANLRLARATFTRISTLHDKRSATAHELDQAAAAVASAEAGLAGAQARAAASVAARDSAAASVEAAQVGLSYAVLTAPFDGIVTERTADPGSIALPGTSLLTVEEASQYRLEVQLDEARVANASPGVVVEVKLESLLGERWITGRVAEISRIDGTSHSFLVKIDVPADPLLRSGAYGRVRFGGLPRQTLVVPSTALVQRGQLTFVFTVGEDGLARLRPITTGAALHERVEVLAGLGDGDAVVIAPPAGLLDGTRVRAGTDQAERGVRR